MIQKIEVDVAASIISKYYKNAVEKKSEKAQAEIKKVMVVIQKLFNIAKEKGEVEES